MKATKENVTGYTFSKEDMENCHMAGQTNAGCKEPSYSEAKAWVSSLPPASIEQEKWVAVKDGLPECGKQYICAYINPTDKFKKPYVLCIWRGRDGWYWDNAEKERADDNTLFVTHWQPLPPKPSNT